MKSEFLDNFIHDLRAPLARALSYCKLLEDGIAAEEKETHAEMRKALEDLDQLMRKAEANQFEPG